MRYGIFSDVHSNLQALAAVMDAYSREGIDMYFCLGDIVGYGADPSACIARIKELPLIALAGNHDWAVAGLIGHENFNIEAQEAVLWTRTQLDNEQIRYLEGLRLVFRDEGSTLAPGLTGEAGTGFCLVHGTLSDPAAFDYMFDEAAAWETFRVMETQLCFVGHTHDPGTFVKDGDNRVVFDRRPDIVPDPRNRYIINAGSVGQPRDGDPRACYCVYDSTENLVQIKRVAYDTFAARASISKAGLPGYLGDRLLSGR